eukprot:NODE_2169_length_752_cov_86.408250_g1748_i0.p1 GENE.NODE_2169_length_752_cov_86.408250_g1748_i0~~NODE_2169_length_752_cov_86.408250_g1748_i0.p1  ORF type:complete len:145 (-),score=11.11 NODE_2169_length_752_cov_86.408250_g1748_i0:240-674(-)
MHCTYFRLRCQLSPFWHHRCQNHSQTHWVFNGAECEQGLLYYVYNMSGHGTYHDLVSNADISYSEWLAMWVHYHGVNKPWGDLCIPGAPRKACDVPHDPFWELYAKNYEALQLKRCPTLQTRYLRFQKFGKHVLPASAATPSPG